MNRHRWIIRVDHLGDSELALFGWIRIADDGEFSLYQRPWDGEQQVVSNEPPRWLIVDDYNDAQQMSADGGRIMQGPPAPPQDGALPPA